MDNFEPAQGTETAKTEKNGPKRTQRHDQADRQQIYVIYRLANVQVVVWLVLSLAACVVNYTLDLRVIATLIEKIAEMTPVNFEPVLLMILVSAKAVTILFLLQLRSANKRMDNIMDKLFGAGRLQRT